MRDSAEFADIAFTGMELLPPGVVLVSEWRAGTGPLPLANEVNCYGGVARKRLRTAAESLSLCLSHSNSRRHHL
jgi:hypothetical protein